MLKTETPYERTRREITEKLFVPDPKVMNGPEWHEVRVLHWDGANPPVAHDVYEWNLDEIRMTDEGPLVYGMLVPRNQIRVRPVYWHRLDSEYGSFRLQEYLHKAGSAGSRRSSAADRHPAQGSSSVFQRWFRSASLSSEDTLPPPLAPPPSFDDPAPSSASSDAGPDAPSHDHNF